MRRLLIVVAVATSACGAAAAETAPDYAIAMERCSSGSELDGYFCLRDVSAEAEAKLKALVTQATAAIVASGGQPDAVEIRGRLLAAQEAWERYRSDDCHAAWRYRLNAPVHPPSQSRAIQACMLRKTFNRSAEIEREYLGGGRRRLPPRVDIPPLPH